MKGRPLFSSFQRGVRLLFACGGCLIPLANLASAQKMIRVPTAPPVHGTSLIYDDAKYGVHFSVPPGWKVSTKDREVSTFRLDARSATRNTKLRAVASLEFNPYPESVLSGALLYYSVENHSNDEACAAETSAARGSAGKDVQGIGGMNFAHGHEEHGGICVEGRDEVYTAYRKGSCYRFDLTVHTFCSISSGAKELTIAQMRSLEERLTGILSSVNLDWESSGPEEVAVPDVSRARR